MLDNGSLLQTEAEAPESKDDWLSWQSGGSHVHCRKEEESFSSWGRERTDIISQMAEISKLVWEDS